MWPADASKKKKKKKKNLKQTMYFLLRAKTSSKIWPPTALFVWLISHDWKYCWLICCERKILFVDWKSMAYKLNEQGAHRWPVLQLQCSSGSLSTRNPRMPSMWKRSLTLTAVATSNFSSNFHNHFLPFKLQVIPTFFRESKLLKFDQNYRENYKDLWHQIYITIKI